MATAVQVLFNGHGGTVVRDMAAALRHAADNLLGAKGNANHLARLIADEESGYEYLTDIGAKPSLAHMLARVARSDGRESLAFQVHDLDAKPGVDSARMHYDLVGGHDPSLEVVLHLAKVGESEEDVGEMADDLYMAVESAVKRVGGFNAGPAERLAALREQEAAFGYAEGHPLRVVPAAVPGEDAEAVLKEIGRDATRRFRELAAKIDLEAGPTP